MPYTPDQGDFLQFLEIANIAPLDISQDGQRWTVTTQHGDTTFEYRAKGDGTGAEFQEI